MVSLRNIRLSVVNSIIFVSLSKVSVSIVMVLLIGPDIPITVRPLVWLALPPAAPILRLFMFAPPGAVDQDRG